MRIIYKIGLSILGLISLFTIHTSAATLGGSGTITQLPQFVGTTSPTSAITQQIYGKAFRLSGQSTGCAQFDSNGTLASTGSTCGSGGGSSYPFSLTGNATSTLTQFNGGLTAYGTSTIGAGGQGTGLTISGGATTTGNAYFAGNVGVGTTTPYGILSVQASTTVPSLVVRGATSTNSSNIATFYASATPMFSIDGTTNTTGSAVDAHVSATCTDTTDPSNLKGCFQVKNAGRNLFDLVPRLGFGQLDLYLGNSTEGYTRISGPDGLDARRIDINATQVFFNAAGGTIFFPSNTVATRLGDSTGINNQFGSGVLDMQGTIWDTSAGGFSDFSDFYYQNRPVSGITSDFYACLTGRNLGGYNDCSLAIEDKDWRTSSKSGSVQLNLPANTRPTAHFSILEDDTSRTILQIKGVASQTQPYLKILDSSSNVVLTATSSGNIGISTSTPFSTLSVNTVAGTDPFAVGSSTGNYFRINKIGEIAIGTTTAGCINSSATGVLYSATCVGGGSGTVSTGVAGQLAWYATGGTTVSGTGTPQLTIGNLLATSTATSSFAGPIINSNGDILGQQASYVVSTSTKTGQFTDVQTAINALPSGGGLIHVRCGTYTLPSGNVGIAPKVSNTVIEGEGSCTQFNFNKANTTNAVEPNVSNLTNLIFRDFYIHQTNATFGGIGINASNTPILLVQNIKIDGTATSTSIKDTLNLSFYQQYNHLDLRDNTSCLDIGGNPVNDNQFHDIRCAPHSGNGGFGLFLDSSSVNGAQNNLFTNFDVEPTGAATGLTALYMNNAVDDTFINAYIEGNATAYNMTSNAQRIQFLGGEFKTNTTYTNNGANSQFLNVDKESFAYNQIMASSTVQDVTGNDATTNSLSFRGNGNFAKTGNLLDLVFNNSTDSGAGIHIVNPGTGLSIKVDTGTTSTPHLALTGLRTSTAGNALCLITTGTEVVTAGNTTCTTSSLKTKHDISALSLQGSIDEILGLNPVAFTYNETGEKRIGFIAEDVDKVDPRLVEYAATDTLFANASGVIKKGEPITVEYGNVTALLVKVVQSQQKAIAGIKQGARSVEENWQWLVIGLLAIGFMYQQIQIRKLKNK